MPESNRFTMEEKCQEIITIFPYIPWPMGLHPWPRTLKQNLLVQSCYQSPPSMLWLTGHSFHFGPKATWGLVEGAKAVPLSKAYIQVLCLFLWRMPLPGKTLANHHHVPQKVRSGYNGRSWQVQVDPTIGRKTSNTSQIITEMTTEFLAEYISDSAKRWESLWISSRNHGNGRRAGGRAVFPIGTFQASKFTNSYIYIYTYIFLFGRFGCWLIWPLATPENEHNYFVSQEPFFKMERQGDHLSSKHFFSGDMRWFLGWI